MFLIEKYNIKHPDDLLFHQDLFQKLTKLKHTENKAENHICDGVKQNQYNDMPHLIFYGHQGSGKTSLINLFLSEIYDNSIYKTKKTHYTIHGYGNSNIDVEINQSNYHLILIPNNSGFDKYLIQNVIHEYASRQILNVFKTKTKFKTVVIQNVDNLSYYAQTSLRCTMEKYIHRCKFILCAYHMARVIEPLKSRCLPIRVTLPTESEIFQTLFVISTKERINIRLKELTDISKKAERNIKKGIWLLELFAIKIPNNPTWEASIESICSMIKSPKRHITKSILHKIKLKLYNIFITNIEMNSIFYEFTKNMLKGVDDMQTYWNIVCICTTYETKSKKGKRHVIHIEAMINCLLCLLY